MNFAEYLKMLRKYAVMLVVTVAVAGLGGLGVFFLLPDEYSAETDLFVSTVSAGNPDQMQTASNFIQDRLQTYVDLAGTRAVLEPVIEQLGLTTSPDVLARQISASSAQGTVLLSVTARAATADQSAKLSEAVANSLITTIEDLESRRGSSESHIRMAVANHAVPPDSPSGPPWWMCLGIGSALGLAIGIAAMLFRDAVDSRVRSEGDVRSLTSTPILGVLPMRSLSAHRTTTKLDEDSAHVEAVRRLRTNLRFARIEDRNSTIVVTSSVPGEGKTDTSVELARSLARAGKRVVLIDVDLRDPSVADRLGLENSAGLTTALLGTADVYDLIQPWGRDELYVLAAGDIAPNPLELLESRAMARLLAVLDRDFDAVILDAPPILPVADGLVMAKTAGRVLHIIAANEVSRHELGDSLEQLMSVGTPISLVLNKMPLTHSEMSVYGRTYGHLDVAERERRFERSNRR